MNVVAAHSLEHPAQAPVARFVPSPWIRRLALLGVVLCFAVVALGAYVRLTAAGLGCPDWPGCYGQLTPLGAERSAQAQAAFPDRPLEVGKAWREMVHRYAATTLGAIIVVLAAYAIATRRLRCIHPGLAVGLLAIVILQGILGMLTVTWRLKPLIVTAHLMFGLTTLGLLWWLWLSLPTTAPATASEDRPSANRLARALAIAGLIALALQIALGGWTSSNYAAVACPDFPRCQDSWWPSPDYRAAFVLWRGLQMNYEGGVLANPARIAIHLTHRLGAVLAALTLTAASLTALFARPPPAQRRAAAAVLFALALQLVIGVSMVVKGFPLWLATAHTAGAALLLLSVLNLLAVLTRGARASAF